MAASIPTSTLAPPTLSALTTLASTSILTSRAVQVVQVPSFLWTTDRLNDLISEFRDHSVLWSPKHRDFRDRSKKSEAWNDIARRLKLERYVCERKMNILRTQFRREWNKKKERTLRLAAAAVTDSVVVDSKWHAYQSLKFLEGVEQRSGRKHSEGEPSVFKMQTLELASVDNNATAVANNHLEQPQSANIAKEEVIIKTEESAENCTIEKNPAECKSQDAAVQVEIPMQVPCSSVAPELQSQDAIKSHEPSRAVHQICATAPRSIEETKPMINCEIIAEATEVVSQMNIDDQNVVSTDTLPQENQEISMETDSQADAPKEAPKPLPVVEEIIPESSSLPQMDLVNNVVNNEVKKSPTEKVKSQTEEIKEKVALDVTPNAVENTNNVSFVHPCSSMQEENTSSTVVPREEPSLIYEPQPSTSKQSGYINHVNNERDMDEEDVDVVQVDDILEQPIDINEPSTSRGIRSSKQNRKLRIKNKRDVFKPLARASNVQPVQQIRRPARAVQTVQHQNPSQVSVGGRSSNVNGSEQVAPVVGCQMEEDMETDEEALPQSSVFVPHPFNMTYRELRHFVRDIVAEQPVNNDAPRRDSSIAFGEHVGFRLQHMSFRERTYAIQYINDILYDADLGKFEAMKALDPNGPTCNHVSCLLYFTAVSTGRENPTTSNNATVSNNPVGCNQSNGRNNPTGRNSGLQQNNNAAARQNVAMENNAVNTTRYSRPFSANPAHYAVGRNRHGVPQMPVSEQEPEMGFKVESQDIDSE